MKPRLSVVTPVHNTAAYLGECIESVLGQTYTDFEYVILDNCSTDGSLEIARQYASKDSRIRVEQTSRLLPQVANYNAALELISSETQYCKLVQADDWLYPECLSEMVAAAQIDPEVALVSAYQMAGERVRGIGLPVTHAKGLVTVLPGRETCRKYLLDNQYFFGSPTSVLYRSDVVRARRPFFPSTSYHEDSEVCFEILRTHKFAFVHRILTSTRVDNISLSNAVQEYGPNVLHAFIIVHRHGPDFLTEQELASRIGQVTDQIYSMLSYRVLKRGQAQFWEYHKRGFQMAGQRLSIARVWREQIPRVFNLLGNPLMTLRKIRNAMGR
jgi:glycosyltransferase involved in cell wall biosynthesis